MNRMPGYHGAGAYTVGTIINADQPTAHVFGLKRKPEYLEARGPSLCDRSLLDPDVKGHGMR